MDREMSGALFQNDKGGVEKRPDYRGDITIRGVKYRLSGWKKQGKNGTFLSLSASVDEGQKSSGDAGGNRPAVSGKQGGYGNDDGF